MSRWLGLALVPAFATAAYAQAPGETTPVAPTPATPAVVADPCGDCIDPMANRFAVGLNVGGMSVTADQDDTQTPTDFRTGELSIRYRATPHFELELLLSGGRQVLDTGEDGDLAMGGGTLAARYRFRAERAWNWWLMGGLGMTVIEHQQSTQAERDAAQRGHVAFGVGLERRFSHLALHAELRFVGMSPRSDMSDPNTAPPPVSPDTGAMQPPPVAPASDVRTAQDLSGGQFTLGASYYF
jgi:hypothetical protein